VSGSKTVNQAHAPLIRSKTAADMLADVPLIGLSFRAPAARRVTARQ